MCPHSKCILSSCLLSYRECCIQPKCSTKLKMKALGKSLETQPAVSGKKAMYFPSSFFFSFILSPHTYILYFLITVEWWAMWWHGVDYSTAVADSCFKVFKSCSAVVAWVSFQYVSCALSIFWHVFWRVYVSYFLSLWPHIPFSHVNSSVLLFCAHKSLCDSYS